MGQIITFGLSWTHTLTSGWNATSTLPPWLCLWRKTRFLNICQD